MYFNIQRKEILPTEPKTCYDFHGNLLHEGDYTAFVCSTGRERRGIVSAILSNTDLTVDTEDGPIPTKAHYCEKMNMPEQLVTAKLRKRRKKNP